MAFGPDRDVTLPAHGQVLDIDVGLRQHMLRVYNYMTAALALTGVVAFAVGVLAPESLQMMLYNTSLKWVVMFSPLVVVLILSFGIEKLSASTAQGLFWLYSALVGVSMGAIFIVYTGPSIAMTFFVTAAAFASLSLYGYTTKRDLTGFGSFLLMGLVGLILASIVNMIWPNGIMSFVISAVGVLLFAGLTAYDTQKIKEMYLANDGVEIATKKAVIGALNLYLDFINLFLYLLRFLGNRD